MATDILFRSFVIVVFWPACASVALPAQTANADYFDPATDPLACRTGARTEWLLHPETLAKALHAGMPEAGTVESADILQHETRFTLVLSCRNSADIEQSERYIIPLRTDEAGCLLATPQYDICFGKTCSGCDWDPVREECFCQFDKPGEPGIPGHCNHMFGNSMLLGKVRRKQ